MIDNNNASISKLNNSLNINNNGDNQPVKEQPKIDNKSVDPSKENKILPQNEGVKSNQSLGDMDIQILQKKEAKSNAVNQQNQKVLNLNMKNGDIENFKTNFEPLNLPKDSSSAAKQQNPKDLNLNVDVENFKANLVSEDFPVGAPKDAKPPKDKPLNVFDDLIDGLDGLTKEELELINQFEVEDFEALLGKVNDGIVKFSHANKNKLTKADYGQNFFTKSFSWRKSANHNYSGSRDLKLVRLALFRAIEKRYGFDQKAMMEIAKDLKLLPNAEKVKAKAGEKVEAKSEEKVGGLQRMEMKDILGKARERAFQDMSVLNEYYVNPDGGILHATELKKLPEEAREAFKPCFSRSPSDVKLLRARMETSALSKTWEDKNKNKVEPADALQICFGNLTTALKNACTVKGSKSSVYDMTGADMKSLVFGYMREAQNVRTMANIFGAQIKLIRNPGDKSASSVEEEVLAKFKTSCKVNDMRSNGSKMVTGDELFRTMFNTLLCAKSTMPKQRDLAGKEAKDLPDMKDSNAKDMEFLYTSILTDFVKESGADLEKDGNEQQLINVFFRFSQKLDDYAKTMRADVNSCDGVFRGKVTHLLGNDVTKKNLTEDQKKEIDGWRQQLVADYQAIWKDCRFGRPEGSDHINTSFKDDSRPDAKGPGDLTAKKSALSDELDERLELVEVVTGAKGDPKTGMTSLLVGKAEARFNALFKTNNALFGKEDRNKVIKQISNTDMRLRLDSLIDGRWDVEKGGESVLRDMLSVCREFVNKKEDFSDEKLKNLGVEDLRKKARDLVSEIETDNGALSKCYGALIAVGDGSLSASYKIYLESKKFFESALDAYGAAYQGFDRETIRARAGLKDAPQEGSLEEKYQNNLFEMAKQEMMLQVEASLERATKRSDANSFKVLNGFDTIKNELVAGIKKYDGKLSEFKTKVQKKIIDAFESRLLNTGSVPKDEKDPVLRNLHLALHGPDFGLEDGPDKKMIEEKLSEIYGAQLEYFMLGKMGNGDSWSVEAAVEDVVEKFVSYVKSNDGTKLNAILEGVGRNTKGGESPVARDVLRTFEDQYETQMAKADELLKGVGDYNELLAKVLGDDVLEIVKALKGEDEKSGFGRLISSLDLNRLCAEIVKKTYDARIRVVRQFVGTQNYGEKFNAEIEKEGLTQPKDRAEIQKRKKEFIEKAKNDVELIWNSGTKDSAGANWELDVGASFKALKSLKDCLAELSDHLAQRFKTLGLHIGDVYPKINNANFSLDDSFGKMGLFTLNDYLKWSGRNTVNNSDGTLSFVKAAGDLSASETEVFRVRDILESVSKRLHETISSGFTNFALNPAQMTANLKKDIDAAISKEVSKANLRKELEDTALDPKKTDRENVIRMIREALKEKGLRAEATKTYPFAKRYYNLFSMIDGNGLIEDIDLSGEYKEYKTMAKNLFDMIDKRITTVVEAYNAKDSEHPCGCILSRTDVFRRVALGIIDDLGKLSDVVARTALDRLYIGKEQADKYNLTEEDKFTVVKNFIDPTPSNSRGFQKELEKFVNSNPEIKTVVYGEGHESDGKLASPQLWLNYISAKVFGKDKDVTREFFSHGLASYCRASNDFCSKNKKVVEVVETVGNKSLTKTAFDDFKFNEETATKDMQENVYDVLRDKLREYHPQMKAFKDTWELHKGDYEECINSILKSMIANRDKKTAGFESSYSDVQIQQMASRILEELRVSREERGLRHDDYIAFDEKPELRKVEMHLMDEQQFDEKGVPTGKWRDTIEKMCKEKIDADLKKGKEIRQSVDAFVKMMSVDVKKPKAGGIWFHLPGQEDPVQVCTPEFLNGFVAKEMEFARQKGDSYDPDGMVLRLEDAMREAGVNATRLDFCKAHHDEQAPFLQTFKDEVAKLTDVVCSQVESVWKGMGLKPGPSEYGRNTMRIMSVEPFLNLLIEQKLESIATAKDFDPADFKKPETQFKMITDLCDLLGLSYDKDAANQKNPQLVMKASDGQDEDYFFKKGGRLDQIANQLAQGAVWYGQKAYAYNMENKAKKTGMAIKEMDPILSRLVANDDFWWALGRTTPVSPLLKGVLKGERHGFSIDKIKDRKDESRLPEYMEWDEYYESNWDGFLRTVNIAVDDAKDEMKEAKVKSTNLKDLLGGK